MGEGWGEVNIGRQFPTSFRKYFEANRILLVALVCCDKMSTSASLGAKEEIKKILEVLRRRSAIFIKETSLMNNIEGRWLGNIYEHVSLKFLNVCVKMSFVNIAERF